ncbi:thioredoxin family protein [Arcobacter arenosus]|uniref:Thioredoxin n=1 Tax=Arcobacter arenosus TaxID=2576037 RepID=A0A5R8Y2M2_9BACT|nr:thioredoxin fold domain-containing protein [Arcobacter arenosus]TLP39567.1 thioredoxin [Arcobacter arenosus]
MLKKLLALIFIASMFLTNLNANEKGKVTGGSYHEWPSWFKESFLNIGEDIEEAKEEDKHVILFLSLDFCPYCTKMLDDNFKEGAKNQEYIQNNFDVIGINIKGSRELALNEEQSMTEKEYADYLKVMYTPTIIFLNQNNEQVVRVNGYRSEPNFKLILDYVKNKEYKNMELTTYLEKVKNKTFYTLKDNSMYKDISDLSKIDSPLAVIFEDGSCTQCDYMYNTTFKNKDVQEEMGKFTVIRFDATSKEKIITPDGTTTTPYDWAKQISLDYRPGILLFDDKKEIARIDALLFSFHFKELFRYVSGEYYKEYPTFLDYLGPRQQELINAGINIDLSDKI